MKRFYMIFAALLLIGSVCFAQKARTIHEMHHANVQNFSERATGWYGSTAATTYDSYEAGEYLIMRPETFPGATTVGEQVTKVKFYNYLDEESYAEYTNMSFTIKIYQGSEMTEDLLYSGCVDTASSTNEAVLGTLAYEQTYTAASYGEQIVELNTPYTITSDNYWVVLQCNGKSLLVGAKGDQISTAVTVEDFTDEENPVDPVFTINDFSNAQYLYYEIDSWLDIDVYYSLYYTSNARTHLAYYYVLPYFSIFVNGASEYVPESDVEAMFLDTIPNPNGLAEATMTLGPTDDLVLYLAFQNNGPDAVTAPVALNITFDGESLLADTIPFSDEENDDLPYGYYQPLNFSQTPGQYAPLTISAEAMNSFGIAGTFDVCFSVSYTGTDNNNENDETCISITRLVYDTITATSNQFGTITPNGEVFVVDGTDQSFTITANDSCRIVSVIVDDVDVTEAVVAANGVYTFENVTANHTIAATFERIPTYTITASANGSGTITPDGANVVLEGQSLSFTIAANDCYSLASVLVDGVEAINDLVNGVYTFENIVANHTIAATFEQITYTITATAGENGTIDPEGEVTANCGEDKAFTITPSEGYRILSLLVDGVSSQPAENNVYTFTNVRADHTIEVTFVDENATTHTITATAGEHGSINPVGEIEVLGGENKEFTILADDCYRITSVLVDEVESIESLVNGVYTFENIAADHTIAATFEIITYTITASANEFGTITPNTEGGEIVNCGTDKSFTITANDSCRLVSVIVDGETNVTEQLVDGVYTFTNVAADHTIAATFERTPIHTITASANEFGTITPNGENIVMEGQSLSFTIAANDSCRLVSVMVDGETNVTEQLVEGVYTFENIVADHTIAATFERIPTHTITASANEFGTITPNGENVVMEGQSLSFTIAANDSCRLVSVMVDETNVTDQLVAGVYTFENIVADHSIVATFERIPTYTITATAGENGTITPSGVNVVMEGQSLSFTIAASNGYRVASVMVDGETNVLNQLANGVYTFTNITANHTIEATFEQVTTYTITATAGENGTINPSGVITVDEGATQAFTITPNGGYRIASVMVDNVEAIENVVDGVYIFQNVNANHTISVTFTESVSVDMVEAASMAIYPNPNTGMFSIDFSNINGDAIYQLIDARGAVVETRNISVVDGETMNFSYNLRAGAYFVRIISNDKVYVEQIVVE